MKPVTIYFKVHMYEIAALAIIAVAVSLRIILMSYGWPMSGSDEGTMGLEAMHIAFRGEHPIFLYGQNYMGVAEAYIGALLFRLFGVSLFALRLGMIALFTLFLIAMYLLASLLYTKRLALVMLALFIVGAKDVLLPETAAVGGVAETLVCGTVLLLLASWLTLTSRAQAHSMSSREQWRRFAAYSGWGFTAGIGLWSHLLIAPFILVSSLLLILFCWRELRTRGIFFLLICFAVGALPLILYNVFNPGQNSLVVFWNINHAGDAIGPKGLLLSIQQIVGTFLYSLPLITSLSPVCRLQDLPLYGAQSPHTFQCVLVQGSWSLGYLTLLTLAVFLAAKPLWRLWQLHHTQVDAWSDEERHTAILQFSRLMLLASAAITLLLYAASPLAAEKPWSTRYLMGLLVATPAMIWPLWRGVRAKLFAASRGTITSICRYGLIVGIGIIFLVGTIVCFLGIPAVEAENQQQTALIQTLSRLGMTHIYGGYWTCDDLIFRSREHITCGVIEIYNQRFRVGLNRYPLYYTIVRADPRSAYVFPVGSDFEATFKQTMLQSGKQYEQFQFDGYVVYRPV